MDERRESEATPTKNRTAVERKSERELVVTRTVNGLRASCSRRGPRQNYSGGGGYQNRMG